MRHTQELILLFLSFSFLLGEGASFRGKTEDQLMGRTIPLSFVNMVSDNYNILPSQINPQRGSYLIIVPDGVMSYLGDFVSFKSSQGFDVHVVPLSETEGSAVSIKAVIEERLAEDPMLEYVLLIGDVDGFAECPSFYYGPENDVSDQKYTHIAGDDNVPDVFIGRLSIDSLSDLAVILAKTIQYARDPLAYDTDWLDHGLIVAGNYSNTYPIPITPKWTSYWLRDELLDHGYSQIDTVFYPPVQQGAPYIISYIDDGVGIVNYRGWGDANGWHYPEFHVEHVNDLNNGWLTPVFMSYVCNSNDFANSVDPCLSEAVLRGGTPTVPRGGVAFIGPSDLHTSTKFNNVINAYMYDAMLNHSVVELGPAMQAGQSGLVREFPAESGPGEAQEFYAHVYNILGDPSLQVYIDTPDRFEIEVQGVHANDGYVDIIVRDLSGDLVSSSVVSIMNNDELLAKGMTDTYGRFMASVDVDGVYQLEIFANKNGFIQGHASSVILSPLSELSITSVSAVPESGEDRIALGEPVALTLTLENGSGGAAGGYTGSFYFSPGVDPYDFEIEVPSIPAGGSATLDPIGFSIHEPLHGSTVVGRLDDPEGNKIGSIALEVELPVFDISFENDVSPNSGLDPTLSVVNFSNTTYSDIWISISSLVEGATIILDDGSDIYSTFPPFSTVSTGVNYDVSIGDVAYGSDITFLVEFMKNDHTILSQEVAVHIEPASADLPVAPDGHGYWAYDDTDTGFEHAPTFNWVELDPDLGGTNGTFYQLDDDDHVDIELPFTFRYYGVDHDSMTISSNGWASFEPCYIDYFWNMSIPMYMGPKAMLAPFSDDLETIDQDDDGVIDVWIRVFTWHDDENGRFIIEWSRALNGYDEITEETFEIILYDQSAMPTASGDGVIDFQYLEVEDVDVTKNYSTVGIESPEKDDGVQYVFNNVYAAGAAPLSDERAIRFTTQAPDNYVGPLGLGPGLVPVGIEIGPAYPNPFNPVTSMDLTVPFAGSVRISVIDILGREVALLQSGTMVPGHYRVSWNGRTGSGRSVASGTYFVLMEHAAGSSIQKLLLLK